ncbi:sialidase-3-like [Alosa sapidissima]|uniref:sialidase-3-like n=1 Tax=Alosa sapidissima TaxID=34773 RepID=UPI001C082788|nr:sialidase-3-like [Alosa sapidissima]
MADFKIDLLEPKDTLVFAHEDNDFRIPALLYVKEWKTFLAFAEKRTSTRDEHAISLVMRAATRQPNGSLQWSESWMDLTKATKDGYRAMNPCPVFESTTGTLYLFFICAAGEIKEFQLRGGQTKLCYITCAESPLRDESWTQLTDLSDSAVGKNLEEFQTFAVGPGHGTQMESGRLLIPVYVKDFKDADTWLFDVFPLWYFWTMKSYALALYSDDRGQTWQVGEKMPVESGEFQMAEVTDHEGKGQLYCNARNTKAIRLTKTILRVEALSADAGVSFSPLTELALQERPKGCQGSVVSFPARELPAGEGASAQTALLFSHPTAGQDWDRLELGVHLRSSLQDHHPWGEPHIIHPGRSGYSDLARCEAEGRFACLMECAESEHHSPSLGNRRKITFQEFQLR